VNLECCFVWVWPQRSEAEANLHKKVSYNPELDICSEQSSDAWEAEPHPVQLSAQCTMTMRTCAHTGTYHALSFCLSSGEV